MKNNISFLGKFFTIYVILWFNVFDTIGRYLAPKILFFPNKKNLILLFSIVRISLIVLLFIIGNSNGKDNIFDSFYFELIIMIFFSLTNGYVTVNCYIYGGEMC